MSDSIELPETWTQITSDALGEWAHNAEPVYLRAIEYGDEVKVGLYRKVRADGYEADIETFTATVRDAEDSKQIVERVMEEIDAGISGVTAIGASEEEVGDESFIHFYCVFEDLLPEGITVDDLTFDEEDGTVGTVSSYQVDEDSNIRIEIYPIHEREVTEVE